MPAACSFCRNTPLVSPSMGAARPSAWFNGIVLPHFLPLQKHSARPAADASGIRRPADIASSNTPLAPLLLHYLPHLQVLAKNYLQTRLRFLAFASALRL